MGETVTLQTKECAGSRLRCLMLTSLPKVQLARVLSELAAPFAHVRPNVDHWRPQGLLAPDEVELGKSPDFLSREDREKLCDWWLRHKRGARLPTWDIVSTAEIDGREGLVLVEAKAHGAELHVEGKLRSADCSPESRENHQQIATAIADAQRDLSRSAASWNISRDSHYQLANRIAWSWKIASLGTPVVLVYLGFLHAEEMALRGCPFRSHKEWVDTVLSHSSNVVPSELWNKMVASSGAAFYSVIASASVEVHTSRGQD